MTDGMVAVDIREAARRLSLSPRTMAGLVASGHLPSRKVGRRRIIPVAALEAFMEEQGTVGPDGKLSNGKTG